MNFGDFEIDSDFVNVDLDLDTVADDVGQYLSMSFVLINEVTGRTRQWRDR